MLKKLSLLPLFTLLPASYYYAQTTVYAYVKDQEGKIIERAEVDLASSSNDAVTDKIGYFQLVDLMPGHYMITVYKPSYEAKTLSFEVLEGEKRKDLVYKLCLRNNKINNPNCVLSICRTIKIISYLSSLIS